MADFVIYLNQKLRKEVNTMRTIIYSVYSKTAHKHIYTNCRQAECVKRLEAMENPNEYEIRYKWFSF